MLLITRVVRRTELRFQWHYQILFSFWGRDGRKERGSTPKRACSQAIYLGELAMLEVIKLLKDCRLYAPHSQIWPEYKLETASCGY